MKTGAQARDIERYIAFDIHKEYVLAGGMSAAQAWVVQPRRIEMGKFRAWAEKNLCESDAVVLETTTHVWDLYDLVAPWVSRTVVAHAGAVRQIAEARVKTDKKDIERLIRLWIADIVPAVWVPPVEVRELRGRISYRNRLVKTSTMIRNRLQSLIHRHNLLLPKGKWRDKAWWQAQQMSALEQIQIRQELAMLEEMEKHKGEVDGELGRQSLAEVWGKQAMRLLQLSGFGVVISMTVLSAIGDVTRFESAKQLVGYSGLGAGVHDSGKEHIQKRITKSGRKELRWALVEAAWQAIRISPYWKEQYETDLRRMRRPNQAMPRCHFQRAHRCESIVCFYLNPASRLMPQQTRRNGLARAQNKPGRVQRRVVPQTASAHLCSRRPRRYYLRLHSPSEEPAPHKDDSHLAFPARV